MYVQVANGYLVAEVRVSFALNNKGHYFVVTIQSCPVKRRAAVLVDQVRVRSPLQEQAHDIMVTALRRPVQRSATIL